MRKLKLNLQYFVPPCLLLGKLVCISDSSICGFYMSRYCPYPDEARELVSKFFKC